MRALLPSTPYGARIDAEDIGQTNPCPMDDTFFDLLRRNMAGLVENFWAAGYVNVIAGSFAATPTTCLSASCYGPRRYSS